MYENKFNKAPAGYGVGEWAGYSYNIGIGCSHNCRYCYARSFFVQEMLVPSNEAWTTERPKHQKSNIHLQADKRVMFPSTHDISPAYLEVYCQALYNILAAGNEVLLVSKPHLECIKHICAEFQAFKTQMEFRFTIGSINQEVTAFWEPGAPTPEERISCLKYATEKGYQTGISMEPILEGKDAAIETFYALSPLTTGTIWIGTMNNLDERVDQTIPEVVAAVQKIKELQVDEEMVQLYAFLKDEPQVRWKDSIKKVVQFL
ncbi:hypothetical protein [Geotalea sp. SG265]|uniref:hypothetical protein n=1 Tax=Geotalea sp. SG265 TaxID=2922867 RepID=UPI001FAFF6C5|nr:hypothetical protein [Geotalea sp. SG265]